MNYTFEADNIYYFSVISEIGGIETFFYQLAKKYSDRNLTIIYREANEKQLKRLRKYVQCIPYCGQKIKCKKAFFNFNTDIINNVEAEEYILVIHGDYKTMIEQGQIDAAPGHEKIDKYVGVSKIACEAFTKVTGKPCELCYNPIEIEEPKQVLNLISATRLTREKGKQRMELFAKALDDAGIPYLWTVFTNDTNAINNPNIIFMKPRLDISNYIASADYLVQLSDNEGYCYSVVEALGLGTPVIVTPCPVFNEIGVVDKKNGYILPFDMKDFSVEDIYMNIPKFYYLPFRDRWGELLTNSKSDYQNKKDKKFKVQATGAYRQLNLQDAELRRIPEVGETWEVDYYRLLFLQGNNPKLTKFVDLVEEEKKYPNYEII